MLFLLACLSAHLPTTAPFKMPKSANEVLPCLWQGSKPPPGHYVFDTIVFGAGEWQPSVALYPGSTAVYAELSDIPKPTKKSMREAVEAARKVAEAYRSGRSVLITCGQGYNRSGLVMALALRMMGYTAPEAVALIRRARGPVALRNKAFLRFVFAFSP